MEGYGSTIQTLAKIMEYTAVAEALKALPEHVSVTLFSDSQTLIETCNRRLPIWRQNGWASVDPDIITLVQCIDEEITRKGLAITWQWLRSHNGNAGNERADELAAQGAREAKASLKTKRGKG